VNSIAVENWHARPGMPEVAAKLKAKQPGRARSNSEIKSAANKPGGMKGKSINQLIWAVLALALTVGVPGRAEHLPFKVYTTAEGLAHDSVNKIVRDSRGFLWFCTADGLSRFDGYRFKNDTQDDGLPHRSVNNFLETEDGTYLVATSGGLSVFNPNGRAYRWNAVAARLEQTGDEPPRFQTFVPPILSKKDLTLNQKLTARFLSLAQDRRGRIWAGTDNGLFQVRMNGGGLEFDEVAVENGKNQWVTCTEMLPDAEGGLFLSTNIAVYWISPQGDISKLLDEPSRSMIQDRDGRLWVDIVFGLNVYAFENHRLKLLQRFSEKDGIPPNSQPFRIRQTFDGRIFIGFEYGFAKFLPDAIAGEPRFRVYAADKINSMAEDGAGNLWLGTDTKGAWKLARTGFTLYGEADGVSPSKEIMAIFADRQGEVYAAVCPNQLAHLAGEKFETLMPYGLTQRSWY
jgi:ligand-binding sensor domain-containing protein